MKTLSAAERLIVAADFKPAAPQGAQWARGEVLKLADSLADTGVCLKVNSVLRACGYSLIQEIQSRGLRVFADLKLYDIPETLATDGAFLREAKPAILTTVCSAGVLALSALQRELPETEVLGVTVLTSLKDEDTRAMFVCTTQEAVARFAEVAKAAEIDGLVCSPAEAEFLKAKYGVLLSTNTPAIRPAWAVVKGDDQNPDRVMTPEKAIRAGADRIIIGRPIVQADDRRAAVERTLEEITAATS